MNNVRSKKTVFISVMLSLVLVFTFVMSSFLVSASGTEKVEVNGVEYTSLSQAIKDVKSNKEPAVIELFSDCNVENANLDGISNSVTIKGNYNINMKNVYIAVTSTGELTFDGCNVDYVGGNTYNGTTNMALQKDAKFSLVNGAKFYAHDSTEMMLYATASAIINVANNSSFKCENFPTTVFMSEDRNVGNFSKLNVLDNSEFIVDKTTTNNGLTSFDITVDNSKFEVLNCANQGLVRVNLTLKNSSKANVSGNYTGINLYSNNIVSVQNGTELKVNSNGSKAFLLQGSSIINVENGGNLEVVDNGIKWKHTDDKSIYADKAAIAVGMWRGAYLYTYTTSKVNFADGANVNVSNNYVRGISNFGTVTLGNGTKVVNNGRLADGETADDMRVETGAGIYNAGNLVMNAGSQVHNNQAYTAGDDIYNCHLFIPSADNSNQGDVNKVGIMTLVDASTFDATLNSCNHKITGWYYDGVKDSAETERFNTADCFADKPIYVDKYTIVATDVSDTALKAAHGISYTVTYDFNGGIYFGQNTTPVEKYEALDNVDIKMPERTGYRFTGWEVSVDNQNVSVPITSTGNFVMPEANVTLRALWEANPTVVIEDITPLAPGPVVNQDKPSNNDNKTNTNGTVTILDSTPLASVPSTEDATPIVSASISLLASVSALALINLKKKKED